MTLVMGKTDLLGFGTVWTSKPVQLHRLTSILETEIAYNLGSIQGPVVRKITTSLVNVSLKFKT